MLCLQLTSYKGFERVWCHHPQVQAFQKSVACLLHPADGGSIILWNLGKYLLAGTAWHCRMIDFIIMVIKSEMKWVRRAERVREIKTAFKILLENQRGWNNLRHLTNDGLTYQLWAPVFFKDHLPSIGTCYPGVCQMYVLLTNVCGCCRVGSSPKSYCKVSGNSWQSVRRNWELAAPHTQHFE